MTKQEMLTNILNFLDAGEIEKAKGYIQGIFDLNDPDYRCIQVESEVETTTMIRTIKGVRYLVGCTIEDAKKFVLGEITQKMEPTIFGRVKSLVEKYGFLIKRV